jgi:hypothetical protein
MKSGSRVVGLRVPESCRGRGGRGDKGHWKYREDSEDEAL